MYVVLVEFTVHPQHASEFRNRVQQQASDSLNLEVDCHVFDVCLDPNRENFFLLYEVYTDRRAFETHLSAQHFLDFDLAVKNWVSDKKVSVFERI
jgi:autoinducer 2-degrading protein